MDSTEAPGRSRFHFSPRSNRAHEIEWRAWGPEAFEEAAQEDKPVLLAISAVWCHWCHVMDETSYSDGEVISAINRGYVPIRVDNDQRPDINARYNAGGWPTTAFLTPDGEVLAAFTYVPPDQMRQVVEQVGAYFHANRDDVAAKVREIVDSRQRAPLDGAGDLSLSIVDGVLARVGDSFDPVYGGFGRVPKFPHTDALDLLLHTAQRRHGRHSLHMARTTLEQMSQGGVFDHEWGGFFRYATNRDWSVPHFEKMLEDNSNLLRNLLRLYRVSGDEAHADTARRVIDYLDRWLSDPATGAFYGSQDADEEFYALTGAARNESRAPYVDRTVYTSWNAMAASAYFEASWTLGRPDLCERAQGALDFLWRKCRSANGTMYRYHDGSPHQPGLLGDQVFMIRALLDAYEVSAKAAYLERAEDLAHVILARFADEEHGGFFDVEEGHESLGLLAARQKPLTENAVAAEAYVRLSQLTRRPEYEQTARRTLEVFARGHQMMGLFAAGYARVVDLVLDPPAQVQIVGDPAQPEAESLHRAALRLPVAARTVQVLHPLRDADRLNAATLPATPAPAAYVCHGATCSAPVYRAEDLLPSLNEMGSAPSRGA